MTELQRTKGAFKVVGKVKALRSKEDTNANGNEYRRLNFGIQTSPVNTIYTDIFGMERDYVKAYSSQDKKTIDVAWDDRDGDHGSYHVLGINLFLEPEAKGDKFKREVLVEWDAVPYIEEHLQENDSVMVRGELQFSEYENKNGDIVSQTRYKVQGISKLKNELDFEAEDFKEVSGFEQDVVIESISTDKKENKSYINTYQIDYKGNWVTAQFTIDGNRNQKFHDEFVKRMKFGDWVRCWGILVNKVEQEEEPEIDDPFNSERPSGLDRRKINSYTQELLLVGLDVSTWERKKYTPNDFIKEEAEVNFGSDNKNPFLDDDSSDLEDSLPF